MEERFFEKVKRNDDCWEWQAKKNNKGYGMFREESGGNFKLAHRVAHSLAYGDIPQGKWVLHHCDNPACCRPEHLFLGDNTANVRDMQRKGRGWKGLSPENAYSILWIWASGVSRKQNAIEHGVTVHAVKHIALRRTWQSLSSLDHD